MKRPASSAASINAVILGLSAYLVGIYCGSALPSSLELITLQSGLIGMLAFVAFSNRGRRQVGNASAAAKSQANHVETRLARLVAGGQIRIDIGESGNSPVSSMQPRKTSGAYRYGIR